MLQKGLVPCNYLEPVELRINPQLQNQVKPHLGPEDLPLVTLPSKDSHMARREEINVCIVSNRHSINTVQKLEPLVECITKLCLCHFTDSCPYYIAKWCFGAHMNTHQDVALD